MDEDAPHTMRWPRVFARGAGYMILAMGLYVLSVGPVGYVLYARSPTIDRAIESLYVPLVRLQRLTNYRMPLWPYIHWWLDLPGGPTERYLRQSTPLPASQVPNRAERIPLPERAP